MNSSTYHSKIYQKKHYSVFALIVISTAALLFSNCQDKVVDKYKASVPVYMTYEELRTSVKKSEPRALENPGKIYFKDNYIFINEFFKGIHIYDNQDPRNPVEKAFIEIPGNVDIAIKENTLYADSYIDLVALDISDLTNIRETYRIKDVFPYSLPPKKIELTEEWPDPSKGVVVDWEIKEIEKEVTGPLPYPYPYPFYAEYAFTDKLSLSNSSSASSSSVGVGGSMARFAIKNNALYVLTNYAIKVVDITNVSQPLTLEPVNNNFLIETVFLQGDYMYIGGQSGMIIFDISDNFRPKFVSNYTHITSCDPVVVEGDYAYVTLRAGSTCRNTLTNQLDVIDIKTKASPKLVKSYSFSSPRGLGVENNILYLCDGDDGLKIFNTSDVLRITENQIAHFENIQATDVIPMNGLLFMVGESGFYQYDYSTITNISLVSKIEVVNKSK